MNRLEPDWLLGWAAREPQRQALVAGSTDWTFSELEHVTRILAGALIECGVSTGGRVATLLADDAASVALVHAARRVGAVLVPLNRRAAVPELKHQLSAVTADVLVHDEEHRGQAAAVVASADDGRHRVVVLEIESLLTRTTVAVSAERHLRDEVELDAAATILFTSGTTTGPKAAVLSHGNHVASADAWEALLRPRADDRWLACLPLFHVAGLAMLIRASRWGVPIELHTRFEPEAVAAAIEGGVSHLSLVAPMLERLLEVRPWNAVPTSLRAVLLGGGPLSPRLLTRAYELGLPLVTTYGMTETSSGVAAGGSILRPRGDPSTFLPLNGVELRTTANGEIEVRGAMVFSGYLEAHMRFDRRAISTDGWFATGDVGEIMVGGELRLLDRRDDLIISGGENVYPAEVEAVLVEHPAVAEAAVLGRPDARWGAVPIALIVITPGALVSDATLAAHCRERLAAYKVPTAFHRRETLPRNAVGKIQRSRLRDPLAEESV